MTANARTTQQGNILARAAIGSEGHIVASPFVSHYIQCVYHLERAVHSRVVHHTHHHAGRVVAVVYILYILCPERELQTIHRQHSRFDGRQDYLLVGIGAVEAPFPSQDPGARMGVACQVDDTGVGAHSALPAGYGGGAGGDRVAVEVLCVVQCVEQAAQCAERHHGRPVGCVAAALGPHIYVVPGEGQQSRQ